MSDSGEIKQFAQELTAIQRPLYVYIVKLVGQPADADDVLQEVNRVLWEKMEDYRPGTNFPAWACKIAYFEILTFRKRHARQRLRLSESTLELLADEAVADLEPESAEREALHGCMEKLPPSDRELISKRYLGETDLRALAEEFRRSEPSLCRSLARIRTWLLECIQTTLAAEASR